VIGRLVRRNETPELLHMHCTACIGCLHRLLPHKTGKKVLVRPFTSLLGGISPQAMLVSLLLLLLLLTALLLLP
jgi:hypothetical protein